MERFKLNAEYVTLAQALKAVGKAGSGGEAKAMVRDGAVLVNGVVETQPGKKLRAGDVFAMVIDQMTFEWHVESK